MKIGLGFLFFILSFNSFAYVVARTETGVPLKWSSNQGNIPLFINPLLVRNNVELDVSEAEILMMYNGSYESNLERYYEERISNIVASSINEWNAHSPIKINPFFQTNLNSEQNTFNFTGDSNSFGAGVIAVTKLSYNPQNGNILGADILMNQSFSNVLTFTLDPKVSSDDKAFIGDVITHEVGHFLGLSHSEVIDSSMIYSVFKGQHTVHQDDIAGVKNIYGESQDGSMSGVVTSGGEPIFGVNVQLVSASNNDVVQGVITDEQGQFFFDNIELDRGYYIMTSPVKANSTLADYYKNTTKKLCPQGDFYPSFFSKCGGRSKGRPQILYLNEDESFINVGEVTIRCSESIDTDYLAKKLDTVPRQYELVRTNIDDYSFSFNGVFSPQELIDEDNGKGDEFLIDLSHLQDFVAMGSKVLNLSINGTNLGSLFGFKIQYRMQGAGGWNTIETRTDTNLVKPIASHVVEIPLQMDSTQNIFELKIYPTQLTRDQQYQLFSAPDVLKNNINVYTITGVVGNSDGSFTENYGFYPYEDNYTCREGVALYNPSPFVSQSAISNAVQLADGSDIGVTCGSIDVDGDGNSGGMMSMVFGMVLATFSLTLMRQSRNILS